MDLFQKHKKMTNPRAVVYIISSIIYLGFIGSAHPRTRREQDPLLATYIISYFLQQSFFYRSLQHDYESKQRIYVKSINRKLTQDILPFGWKKRYAEFDFMYTFNFLAIVLFGFTSTFLPTNCEGELPKCAPFKTSFV